MGSSVFNKMQSNINTEEFLESYKKYVWIYACVFEKANSVAQLPFRIYDMKSDKKEVTEDERFGVLQNPNDHMSRYDLWESWISYVELTGEFWGELLKNKSGTRVMEIWPIRPDYMTPVINDEGRITGYKFEKNGKKIPFDLEKIIYYKTFNPTNSYRGLSTLQSAVDNLNTEKETIQYNYKQLKNGARPSGVLEMPEDATLTTTEFERLKNQFNENYAGSANAHKIVLLEGGLKFKPTQLSPKDAEYLQQRKLNRDEILAIYGVPPAQVGIFESAIKANAEEQSKNFWGKTIKYTASKIEEHLNKPDVGLISRLGGDNGYKGYFDFSGVEALKEDVAKKIESGVKAFDKGAVPPNYFTKLLGLPPLAEDKGDQTFINFNVIPYGKIENDNKSKSIKNNKAQYTEEQKKILWKRFDLETKKYENKLRKDYKKLYSDQVSDIINNLKDRELINNTVDVNDLFDKKEWREKYANMIEDYTYQVVNNAGEIAETEILRTRDIGDYGKKQFNINSPEVEVFRQKRIDFFAREVNESLAKELTDTIPSIIEGMEERITIDAIASGLRERLINKSDFRAARIARTEVVTLHNFGLQTAYHQNAIQKHMWLTQRDDSVRDEHEDLDGVTVIIGEDFPGYTDGYDLSFPSSINERCTTIPVIGDEL